MGFQEVDMDVAQEILGRMSTRDVIRSSAICRSWRHHWTRFLTDVAFDRSYSPRAIDSVLSQISSPLQVFCIVTDHLHRLNGWVVSISQRAQNLRLLYIAAIGEDFSLSASIFSPNFRNLGALKLVNWHLPRITIRNVPAFPNLKDLELRCITFGDKSQLELLLSGCRVLEILALIRPHNARWLTVAKGTLKILKLFSEETIRITFLEKVTLSKMKIFLGEDVVMGLRELFENVSCSGTLELGSSTIEVLSRGSLECTTPSAERFAALEKLKLELYLIKRREVRLMMNLLKIASNVKVLKFYGCFADEANYRKVLASSAQSELVCQCRAGCFLSNSFPGAGDDFH